MTRGQVFWMVTVLARLQEIAMLRRSVVVAFVLAVTAPTFAQQATVTARVPVDCWSSLGSCKIHSGRFGTLTDDYSVLPPFNWSSSCDSHDHLPFGAKVVSVTAEAYLLDVAPEDAPASVTLYLNGSRLGVPQTVTNTIARLACNGLGSSVRYDFSSGEHTSGFLGYSVRGVNTLRFETGQEQVAIEMVDLVITYRPPRKFDFDIDEFTSKADRSILISKRRSDDQYTSRFQQRDREVPINVIANGPTGPVAGQTFFFRVIDPQSDQADAPYAVDRRPGDNDDGLGGTLSGAGITPVSGRPGVYSAISNVNGHMSMLLTITDYAAGDNYQIEASPNVDFICPNGCDKSGVITAWKRAYLENDRMFREGTFLREDIAPCVTAPCPATSVLRVEDAAAIGNSRRIRVIHAPRLDGTGPGDYYFEDFDVVRVNRRDDTIEVSPPITRDYYGPQPSSPAPGAPQLGFLADAVGVITGNDDADLFSPNINNVRGLFTPSFVEYVWLTDDPVPFVPFREILMGISGTDTEEIALIARKWFFHLDKPNHQHLLGAREGQADNAQVPLGRTRARLGTNWSWIFVNTVIDRAPHRNNGEWLFNGEVTAHEVAHLWQVNPPVTTTGGHCGQNRAAGSPRAYNNPQLFCTMHTPYSHRDCGGGNGTCAEFFDGVVAFHYDIVSSEYRTIRHRPDPLPHQ